MLLVSRCCATSLESSLSLSNIQMTVCIDDETFWVVLSMILMSLDVDQLVLTSLRFCELMPYNRDSSGSILAGDMCILYLSLTVSCLYGHKKAQCPLKNLQKKR